jgi:hypothetical protein
LPALYGFGLKKNALYDLINNNNIEKIRSHWSFQWYNIEWLYNDIQTAIEKNIKIFHLISVSIDMKTINSLFFPHIHLKDDKDIIVDYKVTSKFIIKTKNDILDSMGIFTKNYKVSKNICDNNSRDLVYKIEENIFNVWSGKISLIFDMDKHIDTFV